jgi:hypothetical protein
LAVLLLQCHIEWQHLLCKALLLPLLLLLLASHWPMFLLLLRLLRELLLPVHPHTLGQVCLWFWSGVSTPLPSDPPLLFLVMPVRISPTCPPS